MADKIPSIEKTAAESPNITSKSNKGWVKTPGPSEIVKIMTDSHEQMEKFGVEDRKKLIEEELKNVTKRLEEKTASETELKYLVQREQDLREALKNL